MFKLLVTGTTTPTTDQADALRARLEEYRESHGPRELLVIQGGADGIDQVAATWCARRNVHCAEVKALWPHRHRSAGPQRNDAMVALEPDQALAVEVEDGGTADCVDKARARGVPVEVVA